MCPKPEILSAYFDDELTLDRRRSVDEHLKECPACRATLKEFAAQRETLSAEEPAVRRDADHLEEFWDFVGRSRLHRSVGPRKLSVPIPVAAAAAAVLVALTVLNFLPRESKVDMPDVLVLESRQPSPTVVSLTITPNELDDLFAVLEGNDVNSESMLTLPAELPAIRMGEPQMIRPASLEEGP